MAALLERRRRAGRGFVATGVLLAASSGWAAWATGGLETALFTTLVSLAFVALVEELEGEVADGEEGAVERGRPGRGLALNGTLLGASVLTRPEGALFAVTTAAYLLARRRGAPGGWRSLVPWAARWIVPLVALEIWRLAYYGQALPNTFAAKEHGLAMIGPGLTYLGLGFLRLHLWIPAAGIAIVAMRRRRARVRDAESASARAPEPKIGLALATGVPYLVHVVVAGGDFMDGFRFLVPVLPTFFLVAGETMEEFAHRSRGAAVVTTAFLLAYVGLGYETSRDSQGHWTRHGLDSIGLLQQYVDDWSALGRHLGTIAKPGDTLATAAAGCVPYYSRLRTIDQHGLTATDLSVYEPAATARPGHAIVLRPDALLDARPTWILGSPRVRGAGEPPRSEFLVGPESRPRLEREYELQDLKLPRTGGRRCVVAKRRPE
jgi:hypothetical protein